MFAYMRRILTLWRDSLVVLCIVCLSHPWSASFDSKSVHTTLPVFDFTEKCAQVDLASFFLKLTRGRCKLAAGGKCYRTLENGSHRRDSTPFCQAAKLPQSLVDNFLDLSANNDERSAFNHFFWNRNTDMISFNAYTTEARYTDYRCQPLINLPQ